MSTCREVTCCPPNPFAHRADGGGNNPPPTIPPGGGCPTPMVAIYPPDGSYVIFPVFAVLTTPVEGASIFYTLDGSEPGCASGVVGPASGTITQAELGNYQADDYLTYRIYAFRNTDSGRIYSNTYLQLEYLVITVNSALAMEWEASVGADGYRIVRDLTNGGFNSAHDVDTNSFTDADSGEWPPNDTTVTPTDPVPYTSPVRIDNAATTIKARACLAGCDPGPVAQATYRVKLPEDFLFDYLCESGDKVGVFNEFAPNGEANDYQFILRFTLDAPTEILSLEIYQTDAAGYWNSGQSWATQEWLYPFPDPTIPFHTYPLVIIDPSGPTQLNTEYMDSLGTFAPGTYEWRLWGQPRTPLSGFFKLVITLGDGTKIISIIETICHPPPPPPCPRPDPPDGSPDCTPRIVVTAMIEPDTAWRLYRSSTDCGTGAWIPLVQGTSDGTGAVEYEDLGVMKCCQYSYYIESQCSDGSFRASEPEGPFQVPCQCTIEASVDDATICQGESTTLRWHAEHCYTLTMNGLPIDGDGTMVITPEEDTTYTFEGTSGECPDPTPIEIAVSVLLPPSLVSVSVNPTAGCTGDTVEVCWEFTGSDPMTITINGEDAGTSKSGCASFTLESVPATFTVEATNECGSASGSATVSDNCPPPPECQPELYADTYQFNGDVAAMFASFNGSCSAFDSLRSTSGTGLLTRNPAISGCAWSGEIKIHPTLPFGLSIVLVLLGGEWRLSLSGTGSTVWSGHKILGLTPVGSYSKTSGCLTGTFSIS